ncbi:hypothetical protein HRbin39_01602 [bacterium HR39]|nr:hypothetical protein HRbin39_01602 [bacterium HR39]
MSEFRRHVMGAAATLALLAPAEAGSAQEAIAFPEGYRSWHHVKSMLIEEGHPLFADFGGLHHVYANDVARRGYETGSFEDGSVIVFDLLAVERTADNAVVEKERKVLAVMVRDSARFAATGGWGYEAWAGGDPAKPVVGEKAAEACHACHEQAAPDYVFSEWRP